MKQGYKGISLTTSEAIEKASLQQLRGINKALVDAALEMRNNARKLFINNKHGYKVSSIEDAIMVGKFKKGADGVNSIALHAFGNKTNNNSYKARFFVGGSYHRTTKKGHYRGSIEELRTIENALDENILNNHLKDAIK